MLNYHKACSYAWRLDKGVYRDLVHTAFLKYFISKGKNLFDEDNKTVIRTVKNVWFNYLTNKTFMYDGELYQKQYVEDYEFIQKSFMDEIIFRDITELIKKSLPQRQAEVFDKLLVGNTIIDIADEEGKNQNSVRKTVNILRSKLEKYNNPFNGNPTKVVKRIKRKTFESNPTYKEEYEMGDGGDHNEYYTLLTSKENPTEGLLIREGKDND